MNKIKTFIIGQRGLLSHSLSKIINNSILIPSNELSNNKYFSKKNYQYNIIYNLAYPSYKLSHVSSYEEFNNFNLLLSIKLSIYIFSLCTSCFFAFGIIPLFFKFAINLLSKSNMYLAGGVLKCTMACLKLVRMSSLRFRKGYKSLKHVAISTRSGVHL